MVAKVFASKIEENGYEFEYPTKKKVEYIPPCFGQFKIDDEENKRRDCAQLDFQVQEEPEKKKPTKPLMGPGEIRRSKRQECCRRTI